MRGNINHLQKRKRSLQSNDATSSSYCILPGTPTLAPPILKISRPTPPSLGLHVQSLTDIKTLLESRGLSPKRSLGQNFLVDQNLLKKLIDAARVQHGDIVVEVGPGTGGLTEELASRVGPEGRVIACELDDALAAMLTERAAAGEFPGAERIVVVHDDCLESKEEISLKLKAAIKTAQAATTQRAFKLVANLPYGAATPLILTLLTKHLDCSVLAVTIQDEVSDRLVAKPSTSERGMVSVIAQTLSRVTRVATAPRECFWPRPDVTSAMVLLERLPETRVADPAAFAAFCKRLFSHRRKQLGGVLGADIPVPWPDGIEPRMRAEELTLDQVLSLFHSAVPPKVPHHKSTGPLADRTPIGE